VLAGADVIMPQKIRHHALQRLLPEQDQPQEAFLLDRQPFRYPISCIVALRATCAIQLEIRFSAARYDRNAVTTRGARASRRFPEGVSVPITQRECQTTGS
jgi:hypothetical protein